MSLEAYGNNKDVYAEHLHNYHRVIGISNAAITYVTSLVPSNLGFSDRNVVNTEKETPAVSNVTDHTYEGGIPEGGGGT